MKPPISTAPFAYMTQGHRLHRRLRVERALDRAVEKGEAQRARRWREYLQTLCYTIGFVDGMDLDEEPVDPTPMKVS